MPLSNQAPATRASLLYITGGSVLVVWTVVWCLYLMVNSPANGSIWYFVFGLMATGGVFLYIGLRLGAIGRAAKQAESPPPMVVQPVTQPAPPAAQTPVIVQGATTMPTAQGVPPNTAVVVPTFPVQQNR